MNRLLRFARVCCLRSLILLGLALGAWSARAQQNSNFTQYGALGGNCQAVAISGTTAYISEGSTFEVLNVTNPAASVLLGKLNLDAMIEQIVVSGTMAYVADGVAGIKIIDISSPANPVLVRTLAPPPYYGINRLVYRNGFVYVPMGVLGLYIFDVRVPASAHVESILTLASHPRSYGVALAGNRAYVACNDGLFYVANIFDPAHPYRMGYCSITNGSWDVAISGQTAYVPCGARGVDVIDITNDYAPRKIRTVAMPGIAAPMTAAVAGIGGVNYLLLATTWPSLSIYSLASPQSPTPVHTLETPGTAPAVAYAANKVYLASMEGGLRIANIATPSAPAEIGHYACLAGPNCIAMNGTLAYVADYRQGLRIVDVTNSTRPMPRGKLDLSGWSHRLAYASGKVYLAHSSGLEIINVANPDAPTLIRSQPISGAEPLDVALAGSIVYVATSSGLVSYDVSNPASPVPKASINLADWVNGVAVSGNLVYLSIGGPSVNKLIRIYDATNPMNLIQQSAIGLSAAPQGLCVTSTRLYVADLEAGLRNLDITNPHLPRILGSYPATEGRSFLDVKYSSGIAYVGGYGGIQAISVSTPTAPRLLGQYFLPSYVSNVALANGLVYVADGFAGMHIMRYTPAP